MYALSAPRCDVSAVRGLGSRSAGLRAAARAPVPFTSRPARRLTVVRAAGERVLAPARLVGKSAALPLPPPPPCRPCGRPVGYTEHRPIAVARCAADEDDADFEARLAALKKAKGQTPVGEGKKAAKESEKKAAPSSRKKQYDFTGETVVFESGAQRGLETGCISALLPPLWAGLPPRFCTSRGAPCLRASLHRCGADCLEY